MLKVDQQTIVYINEKPDHIDIYLDDTENPTRLYAQVSYQKYNNADEDTLVKAVKDAIYQRYFGGDALIQIRDQTDALADQIKTLQTSVEQLKKDLQSSKSTAETDRKRLWDSYNALDKTVQGLVDGKK